MAFSITGHDLFGNPIRMETKGALVQRFNVPPFDVLDARQGYWQTRKRAWQSIGIQSELGRKEDLVGGAGLYSGKDAKYGNRGPKVVKKVVKAGVEGGGGDGETTEVITGTGTSIFDPVVCELMYTWFCPPNGVIVDPFAGGSVRGIVAAKLGFRYWGNDLSTEQIAANNAQKALLTDHEKNNVRWNCGDSVINVPKAPSADFIFSCPPYGNLEKYSDDPKDISGMDYECFLEAYSKIITSACSRLRDNRFACFVVGNYRCPITGNLYALADDTTRIFEQCGVSLYNDAILITAVGSLPLRAAKAFNATRKLGRGHQYVLIYCKGDSRKAATAIGGVQ